MKGKNDVPPHYRFLIYWNCKNNSVYRNRTPLRTGVTLLKLMKEKIKKFNRNVL